jgi:hypothetical protein
MGSSPWSSTRALGSTLRAGALLAAIGVLVSVACSGRTERRALVEPDAGVTSAAGQAGDSSGGNGGESSGESGGGNGTGEPCDSTDPEPCSSDQDRCCPSASGETCSPNTWWSCTGCDEPCDFFATDSCVDGRCLCGDEPPCSGDAPYCSEGRCIECWGDDGCSEREGRTQCVDGACLECDPVEGTGCEGERLACSDAGECVPCSEELPCPGSLLCSVESGQCTACIEHADCTDPTRPICFRFSETRRECWDCETDEECADRDPERSQCMPSGQCEPCDYRNDEGCGGDAECIRIADGDDFECRGCQDDEGCDDPKTPFCEVETHTCIPCTEPSVEDANARCMRNLDRLVCVTSGELEGACRLCDPATNAGCFPIRPYCDAEELHCVECREQSDCPDGLECSGIFCIGCTTDSDCENSPSGELCVDVPGAKACRPCDPSNNAGCPAGEYCLGDYDFVCSP